MRVKPVRVACGEKQSLRAVSLGQLGLFDGAFGFAGGRRTQRIAFTGSAGTGAGRLVSLEEERRDFQFCLCFCFGDGSGWLAGGRAMPT